MKLSTPCAALYLFGMILSVETQTPVQEGGMSCILDSDTKIMTATMIILKKTSIVKRAYFTKLNSYNTEYKDTGCSWTGTGTDADPFKATVQVDSTTNLPPTGKFGCGYEIVDAQKQIYRWVAYNQIQNEMGRDGDVVFIYECTGKNTPTSATVKVQLATQDKEGEAVRVRPENQMSVLTRNGNSGVFGQVVTNGGINVGQDIKLRVQTKVKTAQSRQASLDHYGVFVFSCDYRTSASGTPIEFIQLNGCPNNHFVDLAHGFKAAQTVPADTATTRWFQTESDIFKLVPSRHFTSLYYIRCYVSYCYGTEGTDNRCQDFCNSNIRRRRSLNDTVESITIQVRVNSDTNAGDENEMKTGLDGNEMIVVMATTLAIIVFGLVIAIGFICCCRRYRRKPEVDWKDTSTTSSEKNLSSYYPGDHHPAYQIRNQKF